MKKFKSLILVLFASALLTTQSGCIVGLATGNAPLAWIGFGLWALTPAETGLPFLGIILDSDNPGRQDALNPLPIDEDIASNQNVSVEDLENYNDELNEVISANEEIESVVRAIYENEGRLSQDEAMLIAKRVGLENFEKLVEIMKANSFSSAALDLFTNAFNLSQNTAKLYLKMRWQVKFKK